MKSIAARLAVLLVVMLVSSGHVGSPDAWYEGPAGPYHVLVHVEAPGVIPGIAVVNVRVTGDGIDRVTAVGNKFDATGGAPPPEIARPADDRPGWYRTTLWIMTSGSNSITVGVHGKEGSGSAVVPLVAVPTRRLEFDRRLAIGLGAMGLVLFAGLLTIIGAAVREAVLPPGVDPDRRRVRLGWITRGFATLVIALLLFGGWRWWGAEDSAYVRSMYRPMASDAIVAEHEEGRSLVVSIRDSSWIMRNDDTWLRTRGGTRRTPLIADHGKLMHLFAVAEGGGAFAHLHPFTSDSVRFLASLPPLPAGRYHIYGDIVHESGLAQTLVSSVEIAEAPSARRVAEWKGDRDDAWAARDAVPDAREVLLEDGSRLHWLRSDSPLTAGRDAELRFAVIPPTGEAAGLEPYMGMPGHAVVVRDDGKIFIHLHPQGTISTAAQRSFVMREAGDSIAGRLARRLTTDTSVVHGAHLQPGSTTSAAGAASSPAPGDTLSFPYAFPKAGTYRVWVQTKRQGRVLTGAFVATVRDRD
jgi:hypothetical protein